MSDDSNHKVTELTALTAPAVADLLHIIDDSESVNLNNKKITVANLLTSNNAKLNGAIGDGVADDTASINSSLAALTEGQDLFVPPGTYKITSELTEPSVTYWGIVGAGEKAVVFDVSGIGSGVPLITATKRGYKLRGFSVIGDTSAAPNYTVNGLKFGNASNGTLEHLFIQNCAKALIFVNHHDSKSFDAIELFANTIDISVETTQSTSLRFTNTSMLESEQSLDMSVITSNFQFHDCTFAARPFQAATKPVDIGQGCFGMTISGSRFEVLDNNKVGSFWDNISIEGQTSTFRAESVNLLNNHWTGKAENHVHMVNHIRNMRIEGNNFFSEPNNADIKSTGQTQNDCHQKNNSYTNDRTTKEVQFDLNVNANPFVELDDQTIQTLTGAGAVDVIHKKTHIVTTGTDALTLADGVEGNEKFIVMKTDGGVGTLTPTNLGNGTTIVFNDVGDSAHLVFTNAAWHFKGGTATLTGNAQTAITFTSADATPSVAVGNTFITAGTTAITDFDDGVVGQTIHILATASITITDGAPIILNGSANYTMTDTDTLTLTMFNDQVWQEVSRSVN